MNSSLLIFQPIAAEGKLPHRCDGAKRLEPSRLMEAVARYLSL